MGWRLWVLEVEEEEEVRLQDAGIERGVGGRQRTGDWIRIGRQECGGVAESWVERSADFGAGRRLSAERK